MLILSELQFVRYQNLIKLPKTIIYDCRCANLIIFLCYPTNNDRKYVDRQEALIHIGLNIRKLRTEKKLSIQELSDKLDIEYNNLIRIEKGRTNCTVATLLKISKVLEIKLTDIFEGVG